MIPPDLFPPEIQVILYIYVFPTISVIFPIAFMLFWRFIVPSSAKEETKAKISKSPLLNWESDAGYSVIERAKSFPEGILKGVKSKRVFMLPRPIAETRMRSQKDGVTSYRKVEEIQRVATRPSILKGVGTPILHGYAGKAIATNLTTLSGLQYAGQSKKLKAQLPIEQKQIGDKVKAVIGYVLLPVDPRVMKKWFSRLWDQSQLRARDRASEEIGYERGKGELKRFLIPIAALMMIFVVGMIFLMISGGNIGGGGG